ncbi:hypothetical protein HID58_031520 [Brassica napus]|uniref:Glycosyltransferase n=2 Tax=Brassica napus TaxID=3708 RepID=A0ABQ8BTP6_BRANA|nr:hypothetical protein HID58_031520 [Brassica napus]CDY48502.1 BnaA09g00210D [Brassica napus]
MEESKAPHVAIIPSPGMGHLIPLVQFAKRLVQRHGFSVTFIVVGEGPPSKAQRTVLDSLPSFSLPLTSPTSLRRLASRLASPSP